MEHGTEMMGYMNMEHVNEIQCFILLSNMPNDKIFNSNRATIYQMITVDWVIQYYSHLRRRKLKLRDITRLAQDHSRSKQSWDLNPGFLSPESLGILSQ